jgi:hypothetical protein
VLAATRRHKQDVVAAVAGLMPAAPGRARAARALALAIDGAIVQAQFQATPQSVLESLATVAQAIDAGQGGHRRPLPSTARAPVSTRSSNTP